MSPQSAPEQPSLTRVTARVAAALCSDGVSTGERARLRRIAPGQPLPLAFTRIALTHLPDNWAQSPDDWATLLAGIAIMAPNAHRPGYGLGHALAETGYPETRLERLLEAKEGTLRTLLLRAARFLAAKQSPCDWTDAARLLLTRDPAKREQARLCIARDYFRTCQKNNTA